MMIDKVMDYAVNDDRVRWVVLTGSRTNPSLKPDAYQDYDIQFGVKDLESFLVSDDWLSVFSEVLIMQKPEAMSLFPPSLGGRFTYLMQFTDGTRLDLMLVPLDKEYPIELNTQVLLDKDGLVDLTKADDTHISEVHVEDCMNEFLWLSFYVLKGIKRDQFIYTLDHLSGMRDMVFQMMAWKMTGNPGQSYKYMEYKLSVDIRDKIIESYNVDDRFASMMLLFELMKWAVSDFDYDKKQFECVRSTLMESMI